MPPRSARETSKIFELVTSEGAKFHAKVSGVSLVFVNVRRVQNTVWWKHLLNTIAMSLVPGYTHVELAFHMEVVDPRPRIKEFYIRCAIQYGESVCMELADYNLPFYAFQTLNVSPTIATNLYELCVQDAQRELPFNRAAFWLNFVMPFSACRINRGGSSVFCSEHVLRLLHQVGITDFDELSPHETTPQRLFDYLRTKNVYGGIKGKIGAMDDSVVFATK